MSQESIDKLIDEINARLGQVEMLVSMSIKSSDRFKPGQRVQFSRAADASGVSRGRKGGVRTGKVVSVGDGWSMTVLLDGYSRPSSFHHRFFDAAPRGRKGSE